MLNFYYAVSHLFINKYSAIFASVLLNKLLNAKDESDQTVTILMFSEKSNSQIGIFRLENLIQAI